MRDDFSGMRVTVMGLGRFGGGLGVTRWLAECGAEVLVTDLAAAGELRDPLGTIDDLLQSQRVRLRLGGHNEHDFSCCDLVVVNPAVPQPWSNPFLRRAIASGVTVTTEIRLVFERLDRRRIIGVTGTGGKSTTAAMIHYLLTRGGVRSHLGGNFGGSLLPVLLDIGPEDRVVIELSSAMLHWLGAGVGYPGAAGHSPSIAVLTNVTPNHLDWHGTLEHYRRSKRNIFAYQRPGDHQVRAPVDTAAIPVDHAIDLSLPGTHNLLNARTAIAAAERAAGVDPADAARWLAEFPGLPHRLELVAEHARRRFFDDSKSTTPAATVLAVAAFDQPARIHLIAGGYDRGADLSSIGGLTDRIAGLYTIGETGKALAEIAVKPGLAVCCETLERAVARARDAMQPDDVLLLSPGCASWDQFENFEQRGEAFARAVGAKGESPPSQP